MRGTIASLKKLATLSALLVVPWHDTLGESVVLVWDPSPDTNVVGYALYYGSGSGDYSTRIDVGPTTNSIVTNLQAGAAYYFVVTAYTQDQLESLPSNEVSYIVPGGLLVAETSAGNLGSIGFQGMAGERVTVQASDDLSEWRALYQVEFDSDQVCRVVDPESAELPHRFYRLEGTNVASRSLQFVPLPKASRPKLRFVGGAGDLVRIEASDDRVNWVTLYRVRFTTNQWVELVDPNSLSLPMRFYRINLGGDAYAGEVTYLGQDALQCRLVPGQNLSELTFDLQPVETLILQASGDWVNWTNLYEFRSTFTNIPWSQEVKIVDPESGGISKRFYRLMGTNVGERKLELALLTSPWLAEINFVAPPGDVVQIQASEDLINWITLQQLKVATNQWMTLVDPRSSELSRRFYRIRQAGAAAIAVPLITTQPLSQNVISGQSATFVVAASSTVPLAYLWRFNDNAIAGATGSSYTRSNVQYTDAGYYSVVVSNVAGAITSSNALLTVNSPPTISVHPLDQTIIAGMDATFSVTAAGTPPLAYQWRLNGTDISAATTSTYTRFDVQPVHAGNYAVRVSNDFGEVVSSGAMLTVNVTLSVVATTGGMVVTTPDQPSYAPGTIVTITAIPAGAYVFVGWSGDASSTDNPLALTVTTNVAITAHFAPVEDLILDNPQASFVGTWSVESAATDKYGPDYRTASTIQGSTPSATGTFRPNILTAGRYDVFVWFPTITRGLNSASLVVSSVDGVLPVIVNQSSGSGGWHQVASGKFFSQGTNGFVRLGNNGGPGNKNVVADAVRWVYTAGQ